MSLMLRLVNLLLSSLTRFSSSSSKTLDFTTSILKFGEKCSEPIFRVLTFGAFLGLASVIILQYAIFKNREKKQRHLSPYCGELS